VVLELLYLSNLQLFSREAGCTASSLGCGGGGNFCNV
jgi:hypothetical protein